MAINKVVNNRATTHGAMRNSIEYILRDDSLEQDLLEITGPYDAETINYDEVYQTWLAEKRLWNKDSGRMYAHNIISFHKDEMITPEQVLEISRAFVERFFPEHQCLIAVHHDKEHLHCHILTNSVSYVDGHKLHQTKRDLEQQKKFTNELCRDRGLSIAEKGHHFDGTSIEPGEIRSWQELSENNKLFPEGKNYEDISVMHRIIRVANNVALISRPLYHYNIRQDSITKTYSVNNLLDYCDAYFSRVDFFQNNDSVFFNAHFDLVTRTAVQGISRLWRWWFSCSKDDKKAHLNDIEYYKDFTASTVPLFGFKTWPFYLRISSFFMHIKTSVSFFTLYSINRFYRLLSDRS